MFYLKCVLVEFNSGGVYKLIITAKYTYLFSLINLSEIFYMLIVSFTEIQPEKEKWKSFSVALLHRKANGKQWKGKKERINLDYLQQETLFLLPCKIARSCGFWTDFNCILWMHSFWGDKSIRSLWKSEPAYWKNLLVFKRKIKITLLYVVYFCLF